MVKVGKSSVKVGRNGKSKQKLGEGCKSCNCI